MARLVAVALVAAAALATAAPADDRRPADGVRLRLNGVLRTPDGLQRIHGNGVVGVAGPLADRALTATTVLPGGSETLEQRFVDGSLYLRTRTGFTILTGRPIAEHVPRGKHWARVDLVKLIRAHHGDPRLVMASGFADPQVGLAWLRAGGTVFNEGHETLRGITAIHYRGYVDQLAASLTGDRALRRAIRSGFTAGRNAVVDVWVAARHPRVLRSRVRARLARRVTLTLTQDLVGPPIPVTVRPPPARDVFDATPELEAQIAAG